jgi:hypothetical protein
MQKRTWCGSSKFLTSQPRAQITLPRQLGGNTHLAKLSSSLDSAPIYSTELRDILVATMKITHRCLMEQEHGYES